MLGFLVTFCLKPILRSVFEKPNPIAGSFLTRAPPQWSPGTEWTLTKLDCMFINWSYLGWSVQQLPSSTDAGKSPNDLQTIYCGFCGISDGWVERLNHWIFGWGNRVSPGALLARLATWALAMLGGKGGFGDAENLMFPMISWWAAAMVFGLTVVVNVCECCDLWPIWPYMAHTHVIRRGFLRKRKSRKTLQTCSTAEDAQCIFPNGSMETFIVGCTVDEFAAQILGGMSNWGYQLVLIVLSAKLGDIWWVTLQEFSIAP